MPYILVVGEKEREAGTVAVRSRGGVDLGVMSTNDFIERLHEDIQQRRNAGQDH